MPRSFHDETVRSGQGWTPLGAGGDDLVAISLGDFLRRDFPPPEMMLAPWLPAKGLAMVFAPRGVGKTHFALGVAFAVATGGSFLRWQAPRPRRVLLIDGEMPASAIQARLAAIAASADREPPSEDQIKLLAADLCPYGIPDISTIEGQRRLQPLIDDADLVVFDNYSTLARSGNENEAESWSPMQHWLLGLRRAGKSSLGIHHAGKGGEQRGTSRREDVMDTVIKLSRPDDYTESEGARFVVSFTKSRGFVGPEADPFVAELDGGTWTTRELDDDRIAEAGAHAATGMSQRRIAETMGIGLGSVNRLLKRHRDGARG